MNTLSENVNYNHEVYQDITNYNQGSGMLANGLLLYMYNNQTAGNQLMSEGGHQMAQSRQDLALILNDPIMQSELSNLTSSEIPLMQELAIVNRNIDTGNTGSLNQSAMVFSSKLYDLNLQTQNMAQQSNESMINSINNLQTYSRNILLYTMVTIVISVIISILVSIMTSSLISNPIKNLIWTTQRISWGDLDATIEITTKDELEELASAINRMCQSLKKMNTIEHEKMACEKNIKMAAASHQNYSPEEELNEHTDHMGLGGNR
jgi:HAMP domain-containing protein